MPARSQDPNELVLSGLRSFYRALPETNALPSQVGPLLAMAQQLNVRVLKGSYVIEPDPSAPLVRYRMAFTARGTSEDLISYVRSALESNPSLVLERVNFGRPDARAKVIEMRLDWFVLARASGDVQERVASFVSDRPTPDMPMSEGHR